MAEITALANLGRYMRELYTNQSMTDVILIPKDNKEGCRAHQIVLARCPKLHHMTLEAQEQPEKNYTAGILSINCGLYKNTCEYLLKALYGFEQRQLCEGDAMIVAEEIHGLGCTELLTDLLSVLRSVNVVDRSIPLTREKLRVLFNYYVECSHPVNEAIHPLFIREMSITDKGEFATLTGVVNYMKRCLKRCSMVVETFVTYLTSNNTPANSVEYLVDVLPNRIQGSEVDTLLGLPIETYPSLQAYIFRQGRLSALDRNSKALGCGQDKGICKLAMNNGCYGCPHPLEVEYGSLVMCMDHKLRLQASVETASICKCGRGGAKMYAVRPCLMTCVSCLPTLAKKAQDIEDRVTNKIAEKK